MVLSQIGDKTGPRLGTYGGQRVFIYDKKRVFAFILDSGIMRKAGKNQSHGGGWPRQVATGKLGAEGIGFNPKLWTTVWKTVDNKGYTFYVYDKKTDTFYRLNDLDLINEHGHLERGFKTPLYLTPLDAYERVDDVSGLDTHLRKAVSR